MRSTTAILAGALLSLVAGTAFTQSIHIPKELRRFLRPAPVAGVQVVDLRSTAAASAVAMLTPPTSQTLAAKRASPGATRSLAASELGSALRAANIELATQNVYATLTPGDLEIPNRAITRIYEGVTSVTPEAISFYIGTVQVSEGMRRNVGNAWVEVGLRDSGVYLVDYSYTYSSDRSVECSVGHGGVRQAVRLQPWREGEDAHHVVVAVNYTAPSQWPAPANTSTAVQLWCSPQDSVGHLYLYGINVTKP